jgi:hypothetical protein
MTGTAPTLPSTIRRLDTPDATRLAHLVSAYDDLQTVLRCCERLMTLLDGGGRPGGDRADDVAVDALWTSALLAYTRAFTDGDGGAALTADDVAAADEGTAEDRLRWHRVLLRLREQHADRRVNPRERYTVGIAQDPAGEVSAVAVTSVRTPPVDVAAVRQAGALAFPLCAVLDGRIDPLQQRILTAARGIARSALDRLPVVEVSAEG